MILKWHMNNHLKIGTTSESPSGDARIAPLERWVEPTTRLTWCVWSTSRRCVSRLRFCADEAKPPWFTPSGSENHTAGRWMKKKKKRKPGISLRILGLSMANVGPDTFAGVRARSKPYPLVRFSDS